MNIKHMTVDKLSVKIFPNRTLMGQTAAKEIKEKIAELLKKKDEINMIFAAAPSQNEVLDALADDGEIEWNRINGFHMDEYIGLSESAPQGFGNFLKAHIFGKVNFKSVNYIDCAAVDPEKEAERYENLLKNNPPDIVVMGIGENGHIAFNDPPVADFADKRGVKVVKLDEVCRNQQVHDGCFLRLEDVPKYAITLTVPTLVSAPWLFCVVPAKTKAKAVKECLKGKIGTGCPASVLRLADHAVLYLDGDSSSLL